MAGINLGNVVGNTIQGLASGLDTESLIKQLSQLKQKPIDNLNTKITANGTKATKFGELNTLLTNLKSAADYLRNPSGSSSQYSNIFKYRTAALSSATLTATSYLGVTANPGALVGNNSIQIGQLAKALELRSSSFNARNVDATTAGTGSYFTAGTFQIGSGIVNSVAGTSLSSDQLAANEYGTEGTGSGVLTVQGIHNIVVTGGNGGQKTFIGGVGQTSAGNISSGSAVLTVTINGINYSTSAVAVNTSINAGANTGIASGTTLTFTADPGGLNETSFDITTSSDIIIDDTQSNLNTFAANIKTGLAGQNIFQARQITNFTDANVKSPLTGLTSTDVKLYSNSFNSSTGAFGNISGFNVEYGAGNTSIISVNINGETFRASGLGTSLNAPITLQSTSTDKELRIDLTGVNVDLANTDDATELERAFDYSFGTRKLVNVTVTAGQTLNDIRFNIDQLAAQTGASASVINVSGNDYRFSLKAVNEGVDNKFEIFDASNVLTHTGLLDTNPATAEGINQAAQDAIIRVDGIEITRSSNTISDAIENVSLNLKAVTPGYNDVSPDSIQLAISNDVDSVSDRVVAFLDAYNALRVFSTEQNQRDSTTNKFKDTAILGGDTTLQNLVNGLLNEISKAVSNTSDSEFNSLSDIGITTQDFAGNSDTIATKNILVYDSTTLKNKLSQNFDKLQDIFEFKFTSSSSNLTVFKTSNDSTLNSFKLDIDVNRPAGQQVKLLNSDGTDYLDSDGHNVYLTASGTKITGKAGTPLAGFEFLYTGAGTETISVSFSQGVGDRLYNLADNYVKSGGIISTTVNDLADKNDGYQTDIQNLQQRLDKYVETLRTRFSVLEQAINSVNNILQLLDANTAAANKNS